jgi:hypothetical protein
VGTMNSELAAYAKGREALMETINRGQAIDAKNHLKHMLQNREEISGIGITPDKESGYAIKVNLFTDLKDSLDIQALMPKVKIIVQVVGKVSFL